MSAATRVEAADRFWNSFFGGAFNAAANWQGGLIPGPGDVAHFGRTTNPNVMQLNYTVDFDVFPINQAFKVEDDFVTFDLNGRTYTTTLEGNEIGNVAGRSGRLTITDGILSIANVTNLTVGAGVDTSGLLTVTTGGRIANTPSGYTRLRIGSSGVGTMIVNSGGVVVANALDLAVQSTAGIPGTGTATITGAGSSLSSSVITVGLEGSGMLNIMAGGLAQITNGDIGLNSFVGFVAGSTGAVTIDGTNSRFLAGNIAIGWLGQGTIEITAGGQLECTSATLGDNTFATGAVSVDGATSRWINSGDLTVGRDGDGTLDITAGGLVQNSNGYIGRSVGNGGDGTGAVTVNGAGSTWTNSNFVYIGYDSGGEGSLSVEAGGTVTCTTGFVGNVADSHGTATVDGPGSTWTTSGTLAVGDGALTISNGGAVVTNGLFGTLAAESTWDAEVTVVGQGSSWSLAGALLTVGFGGTAAVNILDGGNVVSFDARLAADTGSTGTVFVSGVGSTWTIGRRLGVGGDAGSLVSGGTATLNIQPGGTVNVAQDIVIFAGGLLRLEGGTLDAAAVSFNGGGTFNFLSGTLHIGTYNGSLVNQGGTLAPGHSAGTTTITGSYAQQAAGKLAIEIGGTTPGSTYDVVNISSIAGIGGQLQLALLNGFFPSGSDTFTVLTANSGVFGTFANVVNGQRLTTLDSLGSFLVNYGAGSAFNPNHIVLSAFQPAALPGDFNFDGKVDAADYVAWRKGLGTTHTQNGLNIWRASFGQTSGSGGNSASRNVVPEPSSILLLLMLTAAGASTHRRIVRKVPSTC